MIILSYYDYEYSTHTILKPPADWWILYDSKEFLKCVKEKAYQIEKKKRDEWNKRWAEEGWHIGSNEPHDDDVYDTFIRLLIDEYNFKKMYICNYDFNHDKIEKESDF